MKSEWIVVADGEPPGIVIHECSSRADAVRICQTLARAGAVYKKLWDVTPPPLPPRKK